jgi:hypothetical protein
MRNFYNLRNAGLAAVLIAAAAFAGPALAARIIAPQVTGHVTAIVGSSSISVDGHQYLIGAGTMAAKNVGTIHLGDVVGLVLNGPATSSASQVILIQQVGGGQPAPSGQ